MSGLLVLDEQDKTLITGLLLAGGRARRMGGEDKGLLPLAGLPLAAWALKSLSVQVDHLLISANRNHQRYRELGAEVISDTLGDFSGPLAGFAAGLGQIRTPWLVTVPCDSPLVVPDYVSRLWAAIEPGGIDAVVAHDGNRLQPVFSLLRRGVLGDLEAFLDLGERKIDLWLERLSWRVVDFSDAPDMFLNVNTPEDLARVEARITAISDIDA
ncbi:MAG: molybdenum cofactor guanylyltransferase MobA [Arenicellales bacterium]|nr:molybdenum cofactor guanylyltransferase MobA [Arenicellales bacterium]